MKKVLAIASMTIRTALRSRVVSCMLFLLILTVVVLPMTIRGDGTVSGYIQVILTFTLGTVMLILSLATVWASCAAVSQEISEKRIMMLGTKPVNRGQIWLGKWLGLLAMNGIMLLGCGLTVYGLLQWKIQHSDLSQKGKELLQREILVARQVVQARQPAFDKSIDAILKDTMARGGASRQFSEEQVREALRMNMLTKYYSAPQHHAITWTFDLPGPVPEGQSLFLRYKFSTSVRNAGTIKGIWRAGPKDGAHQIEQETTDVAEGSHVIELPAAAVGPDGRMEVQFQNEHAIPLTVLFDPGQGLSVLVYKDTFEMNFVRAILLLMAHLAFLAALGTSAGSAFSMPIATFFSIFVIILLYSAPYIESMVTQETSAIAGMALQTSWLDWFVNKIFFLMNSVVQPLQHADPLTMLGTGEWISWTWTGSVIGIKVLLYGGVFALFGIWAFHKREVALPTT